MATENLSKRQRVHYEKIHGDYTKHYFDEYSLRYRRNFIYKHIFDVLDIENKEILDVACSSGFNTLEFKAVYPSIKATGLDISRSACEDYEKNTGRTAICHDLTQPLVDAGQFDVVMIFGGIHHCIADLETTMDNLKKLVRPGGHLVMYEPNKTYFLEPLRTLWYKFDKYFDAESEDAINLEVLKDRYGDGFEEIKTVYFGGPSYYLIYNSLITRVPLKLKGILSTLLQPLEILYNKIPFKVMHPCFLSIWSNRATK